MNTLVGLAFIFVGCGGAILGILAIRRFQRQADWRRVAGKIVSGRVVDSSESYAARIDYEYVVDGFTLKGNVVKSGAVQVNWRGPAEKILARYPVGSEVTVFVNPTRSGDAVLEPGGSSAYPVVVVLCVVIFILGIVFLLAGLA
jgi:hypothetical protein